MPLVKKEEKEMSAFERMRLQNIAANKALLKGIETKAAKIAPPPKPSPAPKPRSSSARTGRARGKAREPEVKREQPVRTTRQSARLAGVDADSEVLKRKREVEEESIAQQARHKKMRVNDDLSLGDIMVEGRKYESGMDGIKGLIVRGAQPGVRTFTEEDVKETTDETLKELRTRMGGLEMYDKWAVQDMKITPQRVYAMGFHPAEDKPIIFAGDKEGQMGVFDASQEVPEVDDEDEEAEIPDPVISAFKTHSRTITSFVFSSVDMNSVYSASYDSSIRKLDLDQGKSVQIYAPPDADEDLPISAMDMPHSDPNLLYFSTLHGSLGRIDLRSPDHADIWGLTHQKIGGFSLHPLHPHLLATASLDRTMKIWDTRKFVGFGESAHPFLVGEHESRLSVSHASWSAGGHIATSSYDDTIKIYDFSSAGSWEPGHSVAEDAMKPTNIVRHNNQTGRWVTILKPQWQQRPKDGIQKFAIGNMNRFVDVFASDGEQLSQLEGDGITAVPAVAHFHPTLDWVAGGNASGKLCLWM
ncbi:WD repeat-containing protein /-like protein [Zalerion maritima]|uniref:DNA damage-binding protein CMR1 n=1 Tax=Zalerion maritima TaxID=339359 RepID=A0AAD5WU05_9PEZI|nr:WD repeat-containing protein /-like protein [Zalerion maritima]